MTSDPDGIQVTRHRDLGTRGYRVWLRRGLLGIPAAIVLLGLANVFGQRPATSTADARAATMSLYAPTQVRGGLLWEARFDIFARTTIQDARLVLGSGWLEGMTVNTIEPSPRSESSRNGSLELDFGRIPAGRRHLLFVQIQTNPTNVGRRDASVTLMDGDARLLRIDRTVTVFP